MKKRKKDKQALFAYVTQQEATGRKADEIIEDYVDDTIPGLKRRKVLRMAAEESIVEEVDTFAWLNQDGSGEGVGTLHVVSVMARRFPDEAINTGDASDIVEPPEADPLLDLRIQLAVENAIVAVIHEEEPID